MLIRRKLNDGYVLCSTDYAAGELCTLAQVCIWITGHSEMAKIINATKDPGSLHAMLAARMKGCTFEEARALIKAGDAVMKAFRQAAKAGNFGFGGAMGPASFVLAKRKLAEGFTYHPDGPSHDKDGKRGFNGIRFCLLIGGEDYCGKEKITEWKGRQYAPMCKACVESVDRILRPAFFSLYPEVGELHEWVKKQIRKSPAKNEFGDQVGRIPCLAFNKKINKPEVLRYRGGCILTSGSNNLFQALLSDIGKLAYNRASYECYTGERWDGGGPSPLAGSRLPAFMHDEPLAELLRHTAHLGGPRIAEIMTEAGRELAPDVHWEAAPALMECWDKDAEPVYDENNVLQVWHPKKKAA